MIGSMPGSKQKIRIDKQEMQQYKDRIKRASRLSGRCEEILERDLKKLVDIDDISLQFELTVPPSRPGKRTNSAILNDDSWLFSRFKTASNLISESAHEMGLWDLRDDSLHLKDDIKEVVHSIYNTMEENDITPPDEPEFPQLKDKLNKETEDFLGDLCSDGHCIDAVDSTDKTLMYLVRNYVIITEFNAMLKAFLNDLGKMRKSVGCISGFI